MEFIGEMEQQQQSGLEDQAVDQGAEDNPESGQESGQENDQATGKTPVPDGLMSQNQQELYERVAHLEKRVREQEDEIVCVKGALADVLRRINIVETTKSAQNSILPSKPQMRTPRKGPVGQERPRSAVENVNILHRAGPPPQSSRQSPRGSSANSIKKWSSMSNSVEANVSGQHPSGSQLTQSKRSTSHGSLTMKPPKGIKEPIWNEEEGYLKMYLKGRPVILHAPTHITSFDVKKSEKPPAGELSLEWVHGYRGRDCRSNLYTLPTGEVVYFIAAAVVLFNVKEQTQRFYLDHTDDIRSLAIHPDQVTIATGQVAGHEKKEGQPHVRVWDSVTLKTLHVIGEGFFQRAVCCLSFSIVDDGQLLCAVDESNDHVLSVWNIGDKVSKIADTRSTGDPVTACEFHPKDKNSIISCGKGHISFWSIEAGSLCKKTGVFEKYEKPKFTICLAFAESGDVISGDSNGNIYVWGKGGQRITEAIVGAHEGPVFCLCVTKEGSTILSGGGKDRKIIHWDANYKKTGQEDEVEEQYGAVRMISSGRGNTDTYFVGTIRNCILQKTLDHKLSPITQGHKDELWGLAVHPGKHQFLTCGSDKFLYMWDSQSHAAVWSKQIADAAHCCAFHPTFDVAAIGLEPGTWTILDLSSHNIIYVCTDGKEQHECIQFSPDGNLLALGCRDNYIYIYAVSEKGTKYDRIGRCSGHSSYVTHIDFSSDGTILRSNSGDYEVLYWNTATCKQNTSKDNIKDLEWATQTCTLAFNSIGIWPDYADGTDINNCCKNNDDTLIASADDYGHVNLLTFPSQQPRATGHSYKGHSSHVTNVAFLFDGSRLISCGGRDMAVMQWEVSK